MSCDNETEKRFSLDYYTKHPIMCKRFYFLFILRRLWELILCFVCLLFCDKRKEFWGRGQFQTSLSEYHHIGKPGQELKYDSNLETGTESELMGKSCLLEWSSSLNQLPALSGIPAIVNWATPPHTVIKTKRPETCLNVNLMKSFFAVYFLPKWAC